MIQLISDDLALYLGKPGSDVDTDRADLFLQLAAELCETVVSPLPDAARGTVLAVAARAYNNVTSAHQAGIGSAQVSYGTPNSSTGVGGLYLSRTDVTNLKRMSGGGGAFTIDPTPSDAAAGLDPWNQNVTWPEGVPGLGEYR